MGAVLFLDYVHHERSGTPWKKQHTQKMTVRVTAQTAYNLGTSYAYERAAKTPGRVVDKLVRAKNACPAGPKHRNGGNEMKYDCMKPEWADNEPCPLDTGELAKLRRMCVGA